MKFITHGHLDVHVQTDFGSFSCSSKNSILQTEIRLDSDTSTLSTLIDIWFSPSSSLCDTAHLM